MKNDGSEEPIIDAHVVITTGVLAAGCVASWAGK